MSRWLWLGAIVLTACSDSRQIVLSIRTAAEVPCEIDGIRIVAHAAGTTTIEQQLGVDGSASDITLLDDTPDGMLDLEIFGLLGDVEVMKVFGSLEFSDSKAIHPILLEPGCTPELSCDLEKAMEAARKTPVPSGHACVNVKRYAATEAVEEFVDACTLPGLGRATVTGAAIDLTTVNTGLKNALDVSGFQFYGRPVRHVWVAKDGYISFATSNPEQDGAIAPGPFDRELTGRGVPPPPRSVMAFWDALSLRPEGVCYALDGNPGTQKLHVTWNGACLAQECPSNGRNPAVPNDSLNFTITLGEADGRVVLTYGTMFAGNDEAAHGLNATAGLVDGPIGCSAEQCVLNTGLCVDGATPCGYSQVFSRVRYDIVAPRMQFTPVIE